MLIREGFRENILFFTAWDLLRDCVLQIYSVINE
jgi:hypothetical protein